MFIDDPMTETTKKVGEAVQHEVEALLKEQVMGRLRYGVRITGA